MDNTNTSTDTPKDDAQTTPVVVRDERDHDDVTDLFKAMMVAAAIALTIRSLLFEPFNIPSGSMFPTLLVGDYLFVEKYSYGYSTYSFPLDIMPIAGRIFERPVARGDVAVFRQPKRIHIDYIKRIVGLPGDKIQVRGGVLYVNGKSVTREYVGAEDMSEGNAINVYQKYVETLPASDGDADRKHFVYELSDDEINDNTEIFTVPEDHYFAMGDNRDSSLDSRIQDQVGFVPAKNLIGRAGIIFFSTEGLANKCRTEGRLAGLKKVGCWVIEGPKAIRWSRLFKSVNGF